MESTEERKRTISMFGVEVVVTVPVEEFEVEKFKERNAVERCEVGRGSCQAKSISRI